MRLSFRQKILISYVGLFIFFVLLVLGIVRLSVGLVVRRAMGDRATAIINEVRGSRNIQEAVHQLRSMERSYFFRVGLLDSEGHLLYDSKASRLLGAGFDPLLQTQHPEVQQALKSGSGYAEDYSQLFGQRFAYMAKAFTFREQTYILRLAFPLAPIVSMTRDFELGFVLLASLILLTFALITWSVINHLTKPVQRILKAVAPFQQGLVDRLPYLPIDMEGHASEFDQLADTLNQLNERVQTQLQVVMRERNERAALLESLSEGVLVIDHRGYVVYANPAAWRLLGCPTPALLPQELSTLIASRPDLVQKLAEVWRKLVVEHQVQDVAYLSEEPRPVAIDITACPVRGAIATLLVLHDVTSRVQMLRVGRDFVANASHELRTPITIIRGFVEALQEHEMLTKQQRQEIVTKILRNCVRMESLIQNLLLLADVEHGVVPQGARSDLLEVACECQENLQVLYPSAHVTVETDGEGPWNVRATSDLLILTVGNLLNNAAKYSKDPATISLKIRRRNGAVELKVQDCGMGIPAEDLPHIFDRFYTVDKARSRAMGGSGLGLSIVRSIVERLGGRITAESHLGVGTTFTITLQASDA